MTEAPANILIVDDQPDHLRLLSDLLTAQGCRVRQALGGKAALEMAQSEVPELVLLDVNMPEIDGYKVCSRLKATVATQALPVIFLVGLDEPFDCSKAFGVGGADYITKPFEANQVLTRIKLHLTIGRQQIKLQHAIQAHQQIEEKLRCKNQEMQALFEGFPDFFVQLEPDRVIVNDFLLLEGDTLESSLAKRVQQAEQAIRQQAKRERLLGKITQRIHHSLQLDEILNTAVREVRCLLQVNRVMIYQFRPDWSGQIVNESVSSVKFSLFGDVIHDPCLEHHWHEAYLRGKVSAIANIYADNTLKPCYVEMLAGVQVKAVLVLPILQQETPKKVKLWGMLIAHHCVKPRCWRQWEIELLRQLAAQLAIAIQHAEVYHQLQAANQKLERLANLDGLTQIPNRRRFDQFFNQEWRRLKREKAPIALIMCDVDHFKAYNDYYGHLAGDDCLRQMSQALEQVVRRPADLAARYGGEEFAIVLPNTDLEGATHIAQQIQTVIAKLALPHANTPDWNTVTVSLGIASMIPISPYAPKCLIAMADQALYVAKRKGRNTYCVWTGKHKCDQDDPRSTSHSTACRLSPKDRTLTAMNNLLS